MKFYIPPQIPRLALAFAVFISLFLILRHFLIPETFGEYGHYRGASLIDNAKPEIHYAGQQACFKCHQDIEDKKAQDVHSDIHCETCHGPGQKHILSSKAVDILKPSGEIDLQWGILIVVYPFITGLVAGAFILASLERVFKVKILRPTSQIALLTALSFLLVATMPLISHLSQPQRAYEIMITPHSSSAMAIFGFVYLWYLAVVLLLEIWFDYRQSLVLWANEKTGIMRWVYKILTLGVNDISHRTLKWDRKLGYIITVVGIPSAFILHGYVGFIFGSLKANPWWSSPLIPIIFLFSAMVSGIALIMLVYMIVSYVRKKAIDLNVLDSIGKYLFFVLILDFTLESLDQIQRIYEAEESFGCYLPGKWLKRKMNKL